MPTRLRPSSPAAWSPLRRTAQRPQPPACSRPRCFSAEPLTSKDAAAAAAPEPPSPRWLSELQARIGKCVMFGCSRAQASQAAVVVRALATEWRDLTAGSQGFLTGEGRGLQDHKILWGVMDAFQHVNNVTYLKYAEGSRVNWVTNFARNMDPANADRWRELMTPRSIGLIMKSITVDFKLPVIYPDTISVYTRLREPISDKDPSSVKLECLVLSHRHRRAAARLREEVVTYDYRAASKAPVPGFARRVFADTWAHQRREQDRAHARIAELYRLVDGLEGETWDRADAAEDTGSAVKGSGK
ncbi:hypothetical protein RB595_007592 [Gaeumannomyces hyphopodioides]